MKIAVGFITYNNDSAKYLPYFLDSLFKALAVFKKEDILVLARDNSDNIDNENQSYIKKFSDRTDITINFKWSGENIGFSRSYNEMIAAAISWGADSFLMINPDTVLKEGSLFKLNQALFSNDKIASVSPKILRWDFVNKKLTTKIDSCGLRVLPGLRFFDLGQGEEDSGQFIGAEILGPSGAAALYKTRTLLEVKDNFGLLDSRMFMYKEDCDLAYRLFLKGFKSVFVPEAIIYHDRTAAISGQGFLNTFKNRAKKSKLVRSWSFVNQHLLYLKFWKKELLKSKVRIFFSVILMFFYALFFEKFLLKGYRRIFRLLKNSPR